MVLVQDDSTFCAIDRDRPEVRLHAISCRDECRPNGRKLGVNGRFAVDDDVRMLTRRRDDPVVTVMNERVVSRNDFLFSVSPRTSITSDPSGEHHIRRCINEYPTVGHTIQIWVV